MSVATIRRVNIADPDFKHFPEFPDGFRPGIVRLGALVGATNTGISIYELPPGQAIAPYHYSNPEEEWLLVLEGRPTWRHPGGEDELAPMEVVFFPPGPDGAHMVRNENHHRLDCTSADVLEREQGRGNRLSRQRQDRHLDGQRRR